MRLLHLLNERLRSRAPSWSGVAVVAPSELRRMAAEVEDGLRDIDFEEVTTEDRVTFIERAVAWQVRQALRCGRFDLAVGLGRYGAQRIAELYEVELGFRPTLPYGIPRSGGNDPWVHG